MEEDRFETNALSHKDGWMFVYEKTGWDDQATYCEQQFIGRLKKVLFNSGRESAFKTAAKPTA